MKIKEPLICPKCNGTHFAIKRQATYLYTYNLETSDTENWSGYDEVLPYLFDNRKLIDSKEHLECEDCGAVYPYDINEGDQNIQFTILQKAIRSDYKTNPDFTG